MSIVYNFDSSGTLKTQIEQGAECDIFISAGQKQMDQINDTHVMPGTRFNIVSNKVVLIVPKGNNPTGIASFDDIATDKVTLIALGNSDVPVGQYSEEIFKHMGVWDKRPRRPVLGRDIQAHGRMGQAQRREQNLVREQR